MIKVIGKAEQKTARCLNCNVLLICDSADVKKELCGGGDITRSYINCPICKKSLTIKN